MKRCGDGRKVPPCHRPNEPNVRQPTEGSSRMRNNAMQQTMLFLQVTKPGDGGRCSLLFGKQLNPTTQHERKPRNAEYPDARDDALSTSHETRCRRRRSLLSGKQLNPTNPTKGNLEMRNNPKQQTVLFFQLIEPGGGYDDIFHLASDDEFNRTRKET